MARFRFHRGSLADSKATEIQVNSLKELEKFVNLHSDSVFKISNLKCEYYGYDNRPGGYPMTHIVTCEYAHMTGRYPLGFSDELLS